MNEIDDGFGYWLSGFIDGEGSFNLGKSRTGNIRPSFSMSLRDDELSMVEEIIDKTGIGKVYKVSKRRIILWSLGSGNDFIKLIQLLDKYPLRAKKKRDYLIWRKAVTLWAVGYNGRGNRRKNNRPDQETLLFLRDRLMETRKYDTTRIDNFDYLNTMDVPDTESLKRFMVTERALTIPMGENPESMGLPPSISDELRALKEAGVRFWFERWWDSLPMRILSPEELERILVSVEEVSENRQTANKIRNKISRGITLQEIPLDTEDSYCVQTYSLPAP